MTEQEYCDLSDMQLCRSILGTTEYMFCFDEPNKSRREEVRKILHLIVSDLGPKISKAMEG